MPGTCNTKGSSNHASKSRLDRRSCYLSTPCGLSGKPAVNENLSGKPVLLCIEAGSHYKGDASLIYKVQSAKDSSDWITYGQFCDVCSSAEWQSFLY